MERDDEMVVLDDEKGSISLGVIDWREVMFCEVGQINNGVF